MAFDDELAHRVRILLNVRADVDEKRMFGGIVFLLAGNMSVGIRGDELIVRVGPEGSEEALRQPHTRPFDITGRPMKGWILVAAEGVRSERQIAGRPRRRVRALAPAQGLNVPAKPAQNLNRPSSKISLKVSPETSSTSVAPGPPGVTVAVKARSEPAPAPVTVAEPLRTAARLLMSADVIGPVTYMMFVSKSPLPGLPASSPGARARHSKPPDPARQ
jgi:hypothetical protein